MSANGVPAGARPLVRAGSAGDLETLEPLWRRFYEDQRQQGLRGVVPDVGFAEWLGVMRPALGRFACLAVAEDSGRLVGFVAGRVRAMPKHLGGGAAGWITEVWVEPAHRSRGVAAAMVGVSVDWFRGEGIRRIELQIVVGNDAARRLYARLGFAEELVQMVLERAE